MVRNVALIRFSYEMYQEIKQLPAHTNRWIESAMILTLDQDMCEVLLI